ncbi:MAG TPA: hypothetical protein VGR27_14630, partial [Longimicrobiaceae bacterium]|nr:hypothetical protein [Longimicrobiaceae bacterium]
MPTLYIAVEDALLVARSANRSSDRWDVTFHLEDRSLRCVALGAGRPERVFCGTSGHGLWRSDDAGERWKRVGEETLPPRVMAVAAGALGEGGGSVVFAGTEPSRVFRSDDGGESWQECGGLQELPSHRSWSYPPRPDTHHVRCIGLDPVVAGRLFVCIEAGALVRSPDGGESWRDRVPGGPYDTHTLALPPVEGLLYAAAGDGWFESRDGGESWQQLDEGLRHHYLWSVAINRYDPELLLVSAASGARQAHDAARAETWIYRRQRGGTWQPVREGLPEPRGTIASSLAADRAEPGIF